MGEQGCGWAAQAVSTLDLQLAEKPQEHSARVLRLCGGIGGQTKGECRVLGLESAHSTCPEPSCKAPSSRKPSCCLGQHKSKFRLCGLEMPS